MATLFSNSAQLIARLVLGASVTLFGLPIATMSAQSMELEDMATGPLKPSCQNAASTMTTNSLKQRRCDRAGSRPIAEATQELAVFPRHPFTTDSWVPPSPAIQLADNPENDSPEHTGFPNSSVQRVDVDPAIIEGSPVLQRWLEEVPNLAVDIHHDPAFRTRVRVGYVEFPASDNTGGIYLGVQDVFVGRTPLTLSAEYATNSQGDRQIIGADAQYYLLPLGWYGNIAPVVGYRDIQTSEFESDGVNVGLRVIIIPSRTGTADLSVTQSWVAPGTSREVGLTTFAGGYAIAEDLRIGTDIQIQNTRGRQESRVGILLEWML